MSDSIITVENLSKRYLVGHQSVQREHYTALRDVIARGIREFTRKVADMARGQQVIQGDEVEEFWALKDVSFEVKRGEVLGIIGHNGAGKSTLLKILSRITEPTEGRVVLRGRVASLLEVGTGFHPELTGRENIYLNGAILGMTQREIRKKFDEIVAFAEVDRFLDTPVKRYSSGMYVRLAFAVAAHLEPEILVVDEVLAVGDADFQKKCLGKMSEVAGGGRTVLFVSHNMAGIQALCSRSICLSAGKLFCDGETTEVIASYLGLKRTSPDRMRTEPIAIDDGLLLESIKATPSLVETGKAFTLEFTFRAEGIGQIRECAVLFYSGRGIRVAICDIRQSHALPFAYGVGRFTIFVEIANLPLVEGDYSIGLYIITRGFSGNLFDLDDVEVVAPQKHYDFISYPADARGLVVLESASSVVEIQVAENQ
jgi:ABC-type polysaccharide/polyol phosphate transport system ATPase subunit